LFTTVLEQAFATFSEAELALSFAGDTPIEAMTRLMHSVWDFYRDHPEILRLINNENLHEARYLKKSTSVKASMQPVMCRLAEILQQGEQAGVFRSGVDPVILFASMSALGYYVVSNRHTIEVSMGRDFTLGDERDATVKMHTELLIAYLTRF